MLYAPNVINHQLLARMKKDGTKRLTCKNRKNATTPQTKLTGKITHNSDLWLFKAVDGAGFLELCQIPADVRAIVILMFSKLFY
jgi:hypothetical protein